ncbi:MFS transporter [Novosphingobium sp.]|uniref:MFS transporter n=1 Tax=Novosphingobium sp. TaxID=1874826 RepID=UPI00333F12C7
MAQSMTVGEDSGITGATTAPAARRGLSPWLVAMLALAMFINFADRGSLAVAAPLLGRQLAIGPAAMGILLSSFFWTYSLAQPLAGMVAQRWPIRWVMAGGLLAWSLATMLCGLAGGFYSLLLLRMLVGLGESVIYPANARFLAEHAPAHQSGQANGVISAAMFAGPVAGTLVGGLVLAQYGWRPVFVVLGGVSLLWLLPWFATTLPAPSPRAGAHAAATTDAPPGWIEMLTNRRFWAVSIGHFCYCYPAYLLLTWLPSFLVNAQHYSLSQLAWIGAAIPLCSAAGCVISGTLSDRGIAAGRDETAMRKRFMVGGMAATGLSMLAATFAPDGAVVVVCLASTAFSCGIMSPMSFTAAQKLAGPLAAGRWMGLQNMIGNLAGIAAPIITGLVVAQTGSYRMAFLIPAVMCLGGMAAWGPWMGPITPVAWRGHRRSAGGGPATTVD